jgi:uncharacterized protein
VTDGLIFNIAQLIKEPIGATRIGEISADLRQVAPDLEQVEGAPQAPLIGSVRLLNASNGILVQGDLHAVATLACARCLEPVSVPIDFELEEVFVPTIDISTGQALTPEEEDHALWINEHHILDLHEVVRQDVLVAAPVHLLCRDDCRGLCPQCGQNLNEGPCGCKPEMDPRWSALASLLN